MKPVIRTLHSFLRELAQKEPQKKLLGRPGLWQTAAEVVERTEAIAWEFTLLGIRQGSHVCLRTHRSAECALVILALQAIGAVAVLTDPKEASDCFLRKCEARVPVDTFLEVTGSRVSSPRGSFDIYQLPATTLPRQEQDPREPGFLIFTSGTTGSSKAVMLSQYNLVNNLVDSQPLGAYRGDDIALGALPLHHVFGLVLLAGIAVLGYGLYLPEKTDVPSLLETIQSQKLTRMNGVPSLYLAMADQAHHYDLGSLRAGFIGGSPYTPEQFFRIEKALGLTLIPVYGMSECIGIACADADAPQALRASCVGAFYPMNQGRILMEDGSEAAPGEEGEIFVRGPARMLGYYPQRMEESAFLPTGDLGYLDHQGMLRISGRKKDIIIRNGNNLSAVRIENALLSLPGIRDAAVVGLPEERAGEVPWAAVVCSEKAYARIMDRLPALLNKNELPVKILRLTELPRTASGKTDKQRLREVIQQWTV